MNPTIDEVSYAEEQVEEAERRLESVYERIGEKMYRVEGGSEGGEWEMTSNFEPDKEYMEEIAEKMEDSAEEYEKEIITKADDELVASHIQNVIIDCQLCIELAVKAMFKLTGKDHPFSHGISFDDGRTQGFYSEIPDDFDRKSDVVRVIFLTQFWGEFYELAKYGAPQLNVRPEMIFNTGDGSRAIEDAEYCIDVAEDLLEFVEITGD